MRFLLIEDNISLAAVVENRLSLDGHVIDHAKDIATANEYTATTEYDLILLDIMLPDGDGRDFLASRGSKNLKTPIIVLTARSEISDKVSILDLGADDYMTKPIDFSFNISTFRMLTKLTKPMFFSTFRPSGSPKSLQNQWVFQHFDPPTA